MMPEGNGTRPRPDRLPYDSDEVIASLSGRIGALIAELEIRDAVITQLRGALAAAEAKVPLPEDVPT